MPLQKAILKSIFLYIANQKHRTKENALQLNTTKNISLPHWHPCGDTQTQCHLKQTVLLFRSNTFEDTSQNDKMIKMGYFFAFRSSSFNYTCFLFIVISDQEFLEFCEIHITLQFFQKNVL